MFLFQILEIFINIVLVFTSKKNWWRKKIMAKNDILPVIGSWSFIIGIIIAFFVGLYQGITLEGGAGFFNTEIGGWVVWLLAIIGIIVGILAFLGKGTITKKETPGFLLAGIALLVMYAVFRGVDTSALYLDSLLEGIALSVSIFAAPAVGLLSLRAIWDMGKDV